MKPQKKYTNKLNPKEVNKENLFNLFEENPGREENIQDANKKLEDFKNSPTVKIGMFTKLILNHHVFHSKLEKFLQREEPTYNIESTKESSEFVVYNRAWFYLNQVDPSQKEDIHSILDFNPKLLNNALESALMYFQDREEYLRCAHIFRIQQILRESKM